jgi:hypothetical protein
LAWTIPSWDKGAGRKVVEGVGDYQKWIDAGALENKDCPGKYINEKRAL